MTGSECHGIVEEEQWGPGPGRIQRMTPIPKLCPTDDPQCPLVMANELAVVVNQAPTVPGEESAW
jgi:hypothetical protein